MLDALRKSPTLRKIWHRLPFHSDIRRLMRFFRGGAPLKSLLPGHLWLDSVEIVITTKCNLRCPACSNLMQYYDKPYHLDRELVLASMRKLNECFDWCNHYKILGGEPFLNPELKLFLREVPREKCSRASIYTNAMIPPDAGDAELFDILREKKIDIIFGSYSVAEEPQRRFVELLDREGIPYVINENTQWYDYGAPVDHHASEAELARQFRACGNWCKSLFNGALYYCPRSGHGYDLGLIERKPGDYVDVLHNSREENIRQIRRLMWRHRPIEACRYCQRGTESAVRLPRGKQ